MFKWISVLVFIASFGSLAQADEVEGLADQILMKSGTYEMVASFPDQVRAQAAQQSPFSKNQEASNKAIESLISSFDLAGANLHILEYVKNNFTVQELSRIVEWLDTPLGVRLTEAEREAGTVEGQSNLMIYASTLSTNPPPESRILLIQEFEQTLGLTDLTLSMMKEMMIGMAKAANSSQLKEEQVLASELESKMEELYKSMEPMMRQAIWQQMLITSHYIYRDLSEEEIRIYIDYLESEDGKVYGEVSKGVVNTITWMFTNAFKKLPNQPRT